MIKLAKEKSKNFSNYNIDFIEGDAEGMEFRDNEFKAITVSFGFRNFSSYDNALSEFYRVLNNNGKVAILEFSKPTSIWFSPIFKFYFNKIIPLLGSMLSRKDAYMYLPESVDFFLKRNDVCEKMRLSGFKNVKYKDYTFGIVTLYTGDKIV